MRSGDESSDYERHLRTLLERARHLSSSISKIDFHAQNWPMFLKQFQVISAQIAHLAAGTEIQSSL